MPPAADTPADDLLPDAFRAWFAGRGWRVRAHQLALLEKARTRRSTLLVAPTGAGKTLAGFLPSLLELSGAAPSDAPPFGPHTLYVSPLKALAVDIARNLERPVAEMGLPARIETRTGDTPAHKRQRQKISSPDILLTTPEQVALLIAGNDSRRFFSRLRFVVLDELHALAGNKRGDLLALGLARLRRLAPDMIAFGLSATVADPDALSAWLVAQDGAESRLADIVHVEGGARPRIDILETQARLPWAGHTARHALPEVLAAIRAHRLTLVFVNTRWQAEVLFEELWRLNDDNLPIALHHGSLDRAQRRRVEEAMAAGRLKAVVATSTLDLGIDWGDVDLVVHVGAPKGASRLAQRIGRANHRLDEPSRGLLVPGNRFEVLECRAALEANAVGAQDAAVARGGALDVLCQHVLGMAVAEPFSADDLYAEVTSAEPYRHLDRETFERVIAFVSTGGYALKAYERFARIRLRPDGTWGISHPRVAQQYRLNVGTIIDSPSLKVRLARKHGGLAARGGAVLGTVEEHFLEQLSPGDTFRFAGRVLRFEAIRGTEALVTPAGGEDAQVPTYAGSKFALSTFLAEGVRAMLADPSRWANLPAQVHDWLMLQQVRSRLPARDGLLVETFPRDRRFHMVAYPFEGRLVHQTLGMLLTRRLERAGLRPLGFVANDYALGIWAGRDLGAAFAAGNPGVDDLFDEDMLGDDLEAWLADSFLLKRTFRQCAIISGLVERRHPGQEKTGRQMTVSTDLIYDVLRAHEPDHILLKATWDDAATGLLDIRRLGAMLSRVKGRIEHQPLGRISPLSVPILAEIGKERVAGRIEEDMLAESADALEREAAGEGRVTDDDARALGRAGRHG